MNTEEITIYTDGGCSGNPGAGGWAFVMIDGERRRERSGGEAATTNNRMELTAVIEALETVRREGIAEAGKGADSADSKTPAGSENGAGGEPASGAEGAAGGRPVHIYTDSQYVKNGITSWIHNWVKNGWMTSAKKPVKNREYWQRLKRLTDSMNVRWHWVRGHAGDELNERCDAMVQEEMKRFK